MTTVGSLCSGAGMMDLAVCAHYGAEVACALALRLLDAKAE